MSYTAGNAASSDTTSKENSSSGHRLTHVVCLLSRSFYHSLTGISTGTSSSMLRAGTPQILVLFFYFRTYVMDGFYLSVFRQ